MRFLPLPLPCRRDTGRLPDYGVGFYCLPTGASP
jgi:hypothetical protein